MNEKDQKLALSDTGKQLIVVKQLPIIEENLRALSSQIDGQVEEAKSLVCTEDSVRSVKKVRASLNTQYKDLEKQRMAVKNAISGPYDVFLKVYKECVTNKFRSADTVLKAKIDSVENDLRQKKEEEISSYFAEYAATLHVEFLRFADVGPNVTLSASVKSLKQDAKKVIDQVAADVEMISSQEFADEIMVEYKRNGYKAPQAILSVNNRHKEIERQKELAAQREEMQKKEAEAQEKVMEAAPVPESFSAPEEEPPVTHKNPEQILTCVFHVTATRAKLKALKSFLDSDPGYKYE